MLKLFSNKIVLTALAGALASCGQGSGNDSQTLVTDVYHTAVKRQSIGNCWLYAAGSWAESMHLAATGNHINLSESYWTYWHFYHQLVGSSMTVIETGGFWHTATGIIRQHGYMEEGQFVGDEANMEMSAVQAKAELAVNLALAPGGALSNRDLRTRQNVIRVLDEAFGVDMAAAAKLAKPARNLVTGKTVNGGLITLADSIDIQSPYGWKSAWYPQVSGKDASVDNWSQKARKNVLKRVMRALNDYQPVVMTVFIDFNALDLGESAFKLETLVNSGKPGLQGGHMVALEDYVVDQVPDGKGGFLSIEEGDANAELKAKAIDGELRYLKAKNSWGTNRPDRGIIDGYQRFYRDYLDVPFEVTGEDGSPSYYSSALSEFILPPGY